MSLAEYLGIKEEKENKINSKGLMIIDYNLIAISTTFATFTPKTLDPEKLKYVILNSLRANIKRFKLDYPDIVIAVDNGDGGYWRRDIASYYKGNRKKHRDESDWDFDVIFKVVNSLKDGLVANFPYKILDIKRCEADDVAGVLVKHFHAKYEKIMLVSSDGDWSQLQKYNNIKQYNPVMAKQVKPKHGGPGAVLKHKIIKGDRKDGIANILSAGDSVITETKQKMITNKNYTKWMTSNNPEEFCTPEMLARYKENERLLDLYQVPEKYENDILEAFNNYVLPKKSLIYPYLVTNGFSDMCNNISDF